jgi:hypothetical protein
MATLMAVSFMERTRTPFVWYCSTCQEVFALGRMTENPPLSELHKVNANFHTHCKLQHSGEDAIGLTFLPPKEDCSPAALHVVVREATKDK